MSFLLSKMYGLNIYDDNGRYLGKVYDVILNVETGDVVRITTEPLKKITTSREELVKTLQKKSIMFKRVKSVGDILIVGK